jgi:hypothetical protein
MLIIDDVAQEPQFDDWIANVGGYFVKLMT